MKQTVLGDEPDEEDHRRKEKSRNADGRCEDENEEPLHNRLHTMAAVKKGRSQTVKLPWPPSTNCLWRAVRSKNIRSEAYRKWLARAGWKLGGASALRSFGDPYAFPFVSHRLPGNYSMLMVLGSGS